MSDIDDGGINDVSGWIETIRKKAEREAEKSLSGGRTHEVPPSVLRSADDVVAEARNLLQKLSSSATNNDENENKEISIPELSVDDTQLTEDISKSPVSRWQNRFSRWKRYFNDKMDAQSSKLAAVCVEELSHKSPLRTQQKSRDIPDDEYVQSHRMIVPEEDPAMKMELRRQKLMERQARRREELERKQEERRRQEAEEERLRREEVRRRRQEAEESEMELEREVKLLRHHVDEEQKRLQEITKRKIAFESELKKKSQLEEKLLSVEKERRAQEEEMRRQEYEWRRDAVMKRIEKKNWLQLRKIFTSWKSVTKRVKVLGEELEMKCNIRRMSSTFSFWNKMYLKAKRNRVVEEERRRLKFEAMRVTMAREIFCRGLKRRMFSSWVEFVAEQKRRRLEHEHSERRKRIGMVLNEMDEREPQSVDENNDMPQELDSNTVAENEEGTSRSSHEVELSESQHIPLWQQPPIPQYLKTLEDKQAVRKQKMIAIRKQREEQRELERKALEEIEKQKEEEERKVRREIIARRKLQRQEEERRKEEQKRMAQELRKMVLSASNFRRSKLLRNYGIEPWKCFIQLLKDETEMGKSYMRYRIVKSKWKIWHKSLERLKEQRQVEFCRRIEMFDLRQYFMQWKQHMDYISQTQKCIRQNHEHLLISSSFRTLRETFRRIQMKRDAELAHRYREMDIYFFDTLCRRCFTAWKKYLPIARFDKEKEKVGTHLRSAADALLKKLDSNFI